MKDDVVKKVSSKLFIRLSRISLWYLGILFLIIGILAVISAIFAEVEIPLSLLDIYPRSYGIFLLVLGIVWPLTALKEHIGLGVTRRQFTISLMIAAAGLTLELTVIYAVMAVVHGNIAPMNIIAVALYNSLLFLIGWVAAIGFQLEARFSILLGILCAVAVGNAANWITYTSGLPAWLVSILLVVVIVIFAVNEPGFPHNLHICYLKEFIGKSFYRNVFLV